MENSTFIVIFFVVTENTIQDPYGERHSKQAQFQKHEESTLLDNLSFQFSLSQQTFYVSFAKCVLKIVLGRTEGVNYKEVLSWPSREFTF